MAAALRSLLGRPPLTTHFRLLLHDAPAPDQKLAKMKKLQDEQQQDWDAIVRMMVRSKMQTYNVVPDGEDPPWARRVFRVLVTIGVSFICGCNLSERTYHKHVIRTNHP
uniref:Uncharacterized protein n=1 Tax=Oryza glumipatula TaxID=40148 RepID=A0A0E0AF08_9ORYZ